MVPGSGRDHRSGRPDDRELPRFDHQKGRDYDAGRHGDSRSKHGPPPKQHDRYIADLEPSVCVSTMVLHGVEIYSAEKGKTAMSMIATSTERHIEGRNAAGTMEAARKGTKMRCTGNGRAQMRMIEIQVRGASGSARLALMDQARLALNSSQLRRLLK